MKNILLKDISTKNDSLYPLYVKIKECETLAKSYLLDGLQHGTPSLPGLGVLSDTRQTGHAVPFSVLQFLMKSISKQKHRVIYVKV